MAISNFSFIIIYVIGNDFFLLSSWLSWIRVSIVLRWNGLWGKNTWISYLKNTWISYLNCHLSLVSSSIHECIHQDRLGYAMETKHFNTSLTCSSIMLHVNCRSASSWLYVTFSPEQWLTDNFNAPQGGTANILRYYTVHQSRWY